MRACVNGGVRAGSRAALSGIKATAIFVPVAALVAGAVSAIVVTLLVLNHRRQVRAV